MVILDIQTVYSVHQPNDNLLVNTQTTISRQTTISIQVLTKNEPNSTLLELEKRRK